MGHEKNLTDIDKQLADHKSLMQEVLAQAKKQGATACEASLGVETGLATSVRLGDVETLEYHQDKGLSVTVYFNQSKGSANTSDFSLKSIGETVEAACRIARHTAADQYAGLPDAERLAWQYPDLDLYHPWNITAEQAIEIATQCENVARNYDKRITNSEGASVSSHHGFNVFGNSHDFIAGYPTSRHSIACSVIGKDGEVMQRDHWYTVARAKDGLEKAESVGEQAAKRTVARLNAKRVKTCEVPVIFSADVASGLIGHMLRAIRGGSLYRRTSFLLDSLNTKIFPEWLSMEERPHIKCGLGSAPYDSEGVATKERDLIKDGVLLGYILDSYSARRLNMETTGNSGGVHNLSVTTSDKDLPTLIKDMHKGLLITELMGQGVNGVTGDYSRGAAGFWVENGEIQYPVEEITVAGNLQNMYKQFVTIGNDVDKRRSIRTGSILIENMTVAGE